MARRDRGVRQKETESVRSEIGILKRLGRLVGMGASKNIVADAVNSPQASPESIAAAIRKEERLIRKRLTNQKEKFAQEDPGFALQIIGDSRYQAGVNAKINASARLEVVDSAYRAANFDLKKAELVKRAIDISGLETAKDWMWKDKTVSQGLVQEASNQGNGHEMSLLDFVVPPPYDETHNRPSPIRAELDPASFPGEVGRLEKTPSPFARVRPQREDSGGRRTNGIAGEGINDAARVDAIKDLPHSPSPPPIASENSSRKRTDFDLNVERARYDRASAARLALRSRVRDRNEGRGR